MVRRERLRGLVAPRHAEATRFRDEAAQIYIVVAIALQSFYAFATNLDAREKRKS